MSDLFNALSCGGFLDQQCCFCRPIFSTDDLNMDKHKFERFLHPGRFAIASIFAPISFPTLPLIVFKETDQGASVVATGSLRSVDPDRIILKKIVLSG
jgi:pre-rRNA-processing protein TSR1